VGLASFPCSRTFKLYVFWIKNVGAPLTREHLFRLALCANGSDHPNLFLPVGGETNKEFTGLGCRYFKFKVNIGPRTTGNA